MTAWENSDGAVYVRGFRNGRSFERERLLAYLWSQIGDERLCPSRARLTEWNRTMRRMADEIRQGAP
jgi:hypothetical protein